MNPVICKGSRNKGDLTMPKDRAKLKPGAQSLKVLPHLVSALPLLAEPEAIRQSLLCRKPRARKRCPADLWCRLRPVPAVPYRDLNNYVRYSERLAISCHSPYLRVINNQFDNLAKSDGHYTTTGPECWAQTDGCIDGFICAVGSGGTLAGVGMYLKSKNKDIIIGLADPMGSALYHHYTHGSLKAEGGSISEGIGQGRITANLDDAPVDRAYQITDQEALPLMYDLMEREGLYLGGSSAINVAGAYNMAKDMGPGHVICTILCDSGQRYQSKIWNPTFLREKICLFRHGLKVRNHENNNC